EIGDARVQLVAQIRPDLVGSLRSCIGTADSVAGAGVGSGGLFIGRADLRLVAFQLLLRTLLILIDLGDLLVQLSAAFVHPLANVFLRRTAAQRQHAHQYDYFCTSSHERVPPFQA